MNTNNEFVSVIIPSTGRLSLEDCRLSLDKQTRPADEIIVVRDDEKRGASWARNEGIRQVKGNLVAFIDDDCLAPVNWLEKLVEAIQNIDIAAAGGTMEDTDPFLREIRARRRENGKDKSPGNTANIIFRKSSLDQCLKNDGYIFNDLFRHYGSEDFELILRLKTRDEKIVFIDNPVVHQRKVSGLSYLRYIFRRGIGVAMLQDAHKLLGKNTVIQNSILWDKKKNLFQRMWALLIMKILGPFAGKSFSKISYFILFWLGEKTQALGFLWGRILHVPRLRRFYKKRKLI